MPVEGHLYGERTWFYDTRSPVRRMAVSAHDGDSTMVISLWQGDSCTGTFRLPAPEAARLISTLAYGMTEAITGTDDGPPSESGPPRLRELWTQFVRRILARSSARPDSHLRLLK
ncbi:MAG TPA: hypothetical protein VH012_09390 [Acidimicrobiales bacterium]|nr:hypothetical protein [Acidimicrobiales bacterium]